MPEEPTATPEPGLWDMPPPAEDLVVRLGDALEYARLFALSQDLLCVADIDGTFYRVNGAFRRTLGFDDAQLFRAPLLDFVHGEDRERTRAALQRLAAGTAVVGLENRFRCHDGGYRTLCWNATPVAESGMFYAIGRDVTGERQAHAEMRRSHALLATTRELLSMAITRQPSRLLYERLLEFLMRIIDSQFGFIGEVLYSPSGQPYLQTRAMTNIAWSEETQQLYEQHLQQAMEFHNLQSLFGAVLATGEPVMANDPGRDPRRCGTPAGHPALTSFLGLPFYHAGELMGMAGVANRLGGYTSELARFLAPLADTCGMIIHAFRVERQRQEAEQRLTEANRHLHQRASTDGLTGLANRSSFDDILELVWKQHQLTAEPLSLLLIDVDHFKQYNDTLGHLAGDDCLRSLGIAIRACVRRPGDCAARYGGEEFAAVLSSTTQEEAVCVAERIRQEISRNANPHPQLSAGEQVTVSIGIATIRPTAADTLRDFVHQADVALYQAKKQGRNRVVTGPAGEG